MSMHFTDTSGRPKNREQQKTLPQPFPLQISGIKYQRKESNKKSHTHEYMCAN